MANFLTKVIVGPEHRWRLLVCEVEYRLSNFSRVGSTIMFTRLLQRCLRRKFLNGVAICIGIFFQASSAAVVLSQNTYGTVNIDQIAFQVLNGYELEKVAGDDLVHWPMISDWDAEGNLLVVESGGVDSPIEEDNKLHKHRIIKLVDEDGDGSFDHRSVVVDRLPFTEGVLYYDEAIYACAPPNIWKFSDEDQDGVFESREVWFDGQTVTYCANDLHGPYLGRDGWIYWCKGAFGKQEHLLRNGRSIQTTAAHIFRRHPDGGPIEPVVTGGMDNPVEFAMSRDGERFFTSTFLHHPGNGLRDGIAHGIYGGVYGKPHSVIDNHPKTGDLMPIMTELGPAAPTGLTFANRLELFPNGDPTTEYLIATMFNLQKVVAYQLQKTASTFEAQGVDLISSDRIDFHPTDVLQDADGSLLIIDTGGWYDLCCPTSKIDQKTANGGIYRLTTQTTKRELATSLPKPKLPEDWTQISPIWLTAFIHDRRPWVSRCALTHLRKLDKEKKDAAVDMLALQIADVERPQSFRLDSLWALSWMDHDRALKLCSDVLIDDCFEVRQAACHILSLHVSESAYTGLVNALQCENIQVRRVACEALGRLGRSGAIEPLLAIANDTVDRVLQHSIIYALIELNDVKELSRLINQRELTPSQQYCALVAIRELEGHESVDENVMLDALKSDDARLSKLAIDLLTMEATLSDGVIRYLAELWNSAGNGAESEKTYRLISNAREDARLIELATQRLTKLADSNKFGDELWNEVLNAFHHSDLPNSFEQPFISFLQSAPVDDRQSMVQKLRNVDIQECQTLMKELLSLAEGEQDQSRKLNYLASLPAATKVSTQLLNVVSEALNAQDASVNELAIEALQRVTLDESHAEQLLQQLEQFSPRSLAAVVEAIASIGQDQLDYELFKKLESVPAAKTLSVDALVNLYEKRSDELKQAATKTFAKLVSVEEHVEKAVLAKLESLPEGDAIRGMRVFRGQKAACASCHKVGYVGGDIGPELSTIGKSRTRQALLEAIMYPNARLEQSYHSTKVLTVDGKVYNGIIRKHLDSEKFEMQLTADKSVVVRLSDIESQERSDVSIMPSGLAELLSPEELADILAFLESAR